MLVEATGLGVTAVVKKPWKPQHLRQVVQTALSDRGRDMAHAFLVDRRFAAPPPDVPADLLPRRAGRAARVYHATNGREGYALLPAIPS